MKSRYLLGHLIMAAKILLASKWKTEDLPSKEEWLWQNQYMCSMGKIFVQIKMKEGRREKRKAFQL